MVDGPRAFQEAYILLRVSSFVFLLPDTLTSSQDLMTKKEGANE